MQCLDHATMNSLAQLHHSSLVTTEGVPHFYSRPAEKASLDVLLRRSRFSCYGWSSLPVAATSGLSSKQGRTWLDLLLIPNPQVPTLPSEVIRVILEHLASAGHEHILIALLVSRTWLAIGGPLLWRDVVIRPSNIADIGNKLKHFPELAMSTSTLTIRAEGSFPGERCRKYKESDWLLIQQVIKACPNLRSFSIFEPLFNGLFDILDTINSIKLLGPRVQSLELAFVENVPFVLPLERQPGLCDVIRELLPQIRHLRLKCSRWCHRLLGDLDQCCPRLRSIVINTLALYLQNSCCRQGSGTKGLARDGQRLVEAGLLPNLKEFKITSREEPERQEERPDRLYACFQVRDVLQNTTTSYPYDPIFCDPGKGLLRYFDGATGGTSEAIGPLRRMPVFLESLHWIETIDGARSYSDEGAAPSQRLRYRHASPTRWEKQNLNARKWTQRYKALPLS